MKKTIFIVIGLIALGTAWTLYLRWDNKRFLEGLPAVKSSTPIQRPIDTIDDKGSETENENSVLPEDFNESQDVLSTDAGMAPDTAERPLHHSDTHSKLHPPNFRIERKDIVKPREGEEDTPTPSVKDLSVEKIIDNNRQSLIRRHGDIPEIDIFLKLNAHLFEGMKNGEPQRRVPMTPEESLENLRVISILFPSEVNEKAYQEALKTHKELGLRK